MTKTCWLFRGGALLWGAALVVLAENPAGAQSSLPRRVGVGAPQELPPVIVEEVSTGGSPTAPFPARVNGPVAPHGDVESRPDFRPWWEAALHGKILSTPQAAEISGDMLVLSALEHSPRVRLLQQLPLIQETHVAEARAAFDWRTFLDARLVSANEPVGNLLTTGGPTEFIDRSWNTAGGVRRMTSHGGALELSQRIGYQNTNSVFFTPPHQGTARLSLSYTQPLLRGRGRVYNQSRIVVAEIDSEISRTEGMRQLELHLLDVMRAYWRLYLVRGVLVQKRRSFEQAQQIQQELELRRRADAYPGLILRAVAATTARGAQLYEAETAVANAEGQLRVLVNSPELRSPEPVELIPLDVPIRDDVILDASSLAAMAMQQRAEIFQATEEIRSASVRLNAARHELLPALNVVLETYVAGLRGDSDFGGAVLDQFAPGGPSGAVGVSYEGAFNNHAAQARHRRRELELRQLSLQFEQTVQAVVLDVEQTHRNVVTANRTLHAKRDALAAAEAEVRFLMERRRLIGNDRTTSLVLVDLLEAQDRLTVSEHQYLEAQVNYVLALLDLKRAVGSLIQQEPLFEGDWTPPLPASHMLASPESRTPIRTAQLEEPPAHLRPTTR